jgi:predicted TIM-barrel fold metal-dependent hydrolase
VHVFGPSDRFPYSPERNYTPSDCPLEALERLHAHLGFDRCVIVHGGAHGTDNSVTLDAVARSSRALRGVAVIPSGLPDDVVDAMDRAGMRGCRMSTVVSGGAGFEHLEALAAQCLNFGWHVLLHFGKSRELTELAPRLEKLRVPFVLDHLGRVTGAEGIGGEAFKTLERLMDSDNCWVKLASLYRLSSKPYPHDDMLPMISRVVQKRPDRILWGSNWPHPIHTAPMPDDGDLVDLIPLWIPDEALQKLILADNPERLYRFGA